MSRPGGAVTVRAARNASRPRATVPGTKPPGIRAREGHLQSATHSCVTYGPYVTQNRREGPHMSTKSAYEPQVGGVAYRCPIEFRHQVARLEPGTLANLMTKGVSKSLTRSGGPGWGRG